MVRMTLVSAVASMLWLGCTAAGESSAPPAGAGGKADSLSCPANGNFVATGDWPSFSEWSFSLSDGRLLDSHTDDLSAEEWPTDLSFGDGTRRITLSQVMEASDAIIHTVLHLEQVGCTDGFPELSVIAAYTAMFDQTGSEGDSFERHDVSVTFVGPVEGQCSSATVEEDCAYTTVDSNDFECVMGPLARCEAGQCLYRMESESCESPDDCFDRPCIDGVCHLELDAIDFEDCPEGSFEE